MAFKVKWEDEPDITSVETYRGAHLVVIVSLVCLTCCVVPRIHSAWRLETEHRRTEDVVTSGRISLAVVEWLEPLHFLCQCVWMQGSNPLRIHSVNNPLKAKSLWQTADLFTSPVHHERWSQGLVTILLDRELLYLLDLNWFVYDTPSDWYNGAPSDHFYWVS